ncbi:MAG: hypothetical protein ACXADY_17965, partial [Candidatus Hodarchaeales archaeon]
MSHRKMWKFLFPLLFLLLFSIASSKCSLSESIKSDFIYCEDNDPSIPILSKPIRFTNNEIQINNIYNENISWIDSTIILSESISFNSSSNLLIENCTIILTPPSASSHIKVIIGETSRLNISNSILYVAKSTGGAASLEFYGNELYIVNSSFIGLGENDYNPGFYILNSQISIIINSNFLSGFDGLIFSHSQNIEIIDCLFQDFVSVTGYGGIAIYGYNSDGINVTGCTINNTQVGISLQNCRRISVQESIFEQGNFGLYINPNSQYSEINDVWIENNTFKDSNFGIMAIGEEIYILNNFFTNLSFTGVNIAGRDIFISFNTFQLLRRGITSITSLVSPNNFSPIASVSNIEIKGNIFDQITAVGILIQNYDFPTIFYITENNFTQNEIGITFQGNLGGISSTERSWVTGNIFNNISEYAIQGISYEFLAHFQYTSFVGNAFINSSNPTLFQTNYYYMDDIRWDDGFIGNYWEIFLTDSIDEDSNQIGDNFYSISADHGQLDRAPLLSLDFIRKSQFCSTHPSDF